MSQTAALADHIDDRTDAILAVWRAAVESNGDVPEARRLSYAEFVDHVPDILDRIADRLRGESTEPGDAGRKHGRVRWKQGYDVGHVVTELGHLRAALLQATFAHARDNGGDLDSLERASAAINEVLDEAVADSVAQYQSESQASARAILAEAERRRVAVDAERSKLQTVLNNLPVGVWVLNAEGVIVALNREAERLQGFPAAETVGRIDLNHFRPHYDLSGPDGRPLDPAELPGLRALAGEDVVQQEVIWRLGGEARSVVSNASSLRDAAGAIAGAVVVAQDVTEPARLRAELARSESRFRTIAERTPVMIWRADASGRRDYVNRAWLEFRGRAAAQEAGEGWAEGVHPDDRERCLAAVRDALGPAPRSRSTTASSAATASTAGSSTGAPRIPTTRASRSAPSARASTSPSASSSRSRWSGSPSTRPGSWPRSRTTPGPRSTPSSSRRNCSRPRSGAATTPRSPRASA
jgi:PAS domain S-box-containing protein